MIIYKIEQRNVDSWVSNPITREAYFLDKEKALVEAEAWPGYGVGTDIHIIDVEVVE